jgi:hypothetical protein
MAAVRNDGVPPRRCGVRDDNSKLNDALFTPLIQQEAPHSTERRRVYSLKARRARRARRTKDVFLLKRANVVLL